MIILSKLFILYLLEISFFESIKTKAEQKYKGC